MVYLPDISQTAFCNKLIQACYRQNENCSLIHIEVAILPIMGYNIAGNFIPEGCMMDYISVAEAAKRWGLSERSVRNYCAKGRIPGALLTGKTWNVPENAEKPARKPRSDAGRRDLLTVLREEKATKLHGGIYHKIQIDLTYNSNHIEGSRLTWRSCRKRNCRPRP